MSRLLLMVALSACVVTAAGLAAPVPAPAPTSEDERLLARSKKFAAQGKIDLFVVCTAAIKLKADDLRMWEPAADYGRKLIEKAEMTGDRKPQTTPSSYKDFATFTDRFKIGFKRMDTTYFRPNPNDAVPPIPSYKEAIQAPGVVDPDGIVYCLILSRGHVESEFGIQHSVVFANGDVTTRSILQSVVIVCDGDVTSTEDDIGRSVIVARGNITAKSAGTVVLMAGGKITLENKPTNKVKVPSVILENQPNTLGITFFELAQVGLKVKTADGAVTVDAVTAKSESEKAGLKAGDKFLEVNGKKPTDAESLRRLLRDALAVGDASVMLKRGTDTHTVKVNLPD